MAISCRTVRALIEIYVDGELREGTSGIMRCHFQRCRVCRGKLNAEIRFREQLRSAYCMKPHSLAKLRKRIVRQLKLAADESRVAELKGTS